MTALADTVIQPNEPENVRRPKLQRILDHLIEAELITLDDVIVALAALTPAANKLPYFATATTAALVDFPAAARSALPLLSGTNTGDQTDVAPATHAATSKATPVDADELPLVDSGASYTLKKLTWGDLKAALNALYPVYSTGTFTPGILIGGASTGITYSVQSGRYTKIGRAVYATVRVALTSKGALTGNVDISGLPFTSNSALPYAVGNMLANNVASLNVPMALVLNNQSTAALYNQSGTGFARITDANLTSTTDLYIGIVYDS